MNERVSALDASLRDRGSRLILRRGDSEAELRRLIDETGADAVFMNRRFEPDAFARDADIAHGLQADGDGLFEDRRAAGHIKHFHLGIGRVDHVKACAVAGQGHGPNVTGLEGDELAHGWWGAWRATARAATEPPSHAVQKKLSIGNGDVLIAAITSCTNTSNPGVLLAAGLLAKKAVEAGLKVQPHIKTSLAPGSRIVTEYLTATGLLPYLEKLGFSLAGYGCTTCIGNAGDLTPELNAVITQNDLVCAAVLSGNRNFEARIHPNLKANFLASPPLVVAYAIAGTVMKDLMTEPVGTGHGGRLMDYVMDFAREKNFKRITLLTDRISNVSQQFFERHGFTHSAMIPMRRVF